ncbi:MAG: PA14 domain-containing protein [Candidatus Brocadia sp.]|nr:PA14 domain-containing protein [Candidatus Brocadia sp.]
MAFKFKILQWLDVDEKEIILFLVCFFSYGYFFHGGGANQNATYDLIRSIVEYGELSINRFVYNTHDVSVYKNNFFSNKGPGLAFLGVPIGFVLFKAKHVFLHFMMEDTYLLLVCHFINWLTVGFISAISCVVLFRFISRLTQCTTAAFIGTMGYAFGTTAFAYSTIFYTHQIAAAFSFIPFYIVFTLKNKKIECFSSLFFSGLLAGYSVITEYPCIFVWLVLFLYVLFLFSDNKKQVFFFLTGSSIPAIILLSYNYLCYGNPMLFSYFSHFVSNADIQSGLKGTAKTISFPSIEILYKITFDPYRGIFFYCPFLLTFFPGIYFFLKKKGISTEFPLLVVIVIYYFVFNASYRYWYGGLSLGPRHLVATLPFMVLLSSFFIKQYPKISICGVLVSFFSMLMAVSVTPETPYGYKNPMVQFYFKNFIDSNFSLNKTPIFRTDISRDTFNSFNLGTLLHLPDALTLIPFYLIIIVGTISFVSKAELKISDIFTNSFFISNINNGVATLKRNIAYFKLSLIILLAGILSTQIAIAILGEKNAPFNKESNYIIQPGFLGWYYENKTFDGKPKLVRYDNMISFNDISFNEIFSGRQFSVIWSGRLYTPRSGHYKFSTESDDGSFLYINDKLIVDNGGDHGIKTVKGSMYLTEGYYDIKIKYFNSKGSSHIKVFWEMPEGLRSQLNKDNVSNYIISPESPGAATPQPKL